MLSGPMLSATKETLPGFVQPMLLRSGERPASADDWAAEVKWDGMRAQVICDGRRLVLRSRPGRDCTSEFPELRDLAHALEGRKVVLDGEVVCFGPDGKPHFELLRARLGRGGARQMAVATLILFDVLHLDGFAVRQLEYESRRRLLQELALEGPTWRTPRFYADCAALVHATKEQGLEGVVFKRLQAPYAAGRRNGAWLKLKHRRCETFEITGWRPGRELGERDEFLVARRLPEGRLSPAGSVAFGLSADMARELRAALATRETGTSRRASGTRWVAPGIKVDVDAHGYADGPVRDGVIRSVTLSD